MDIIILVHTIKYLQLTLDPDLYVAHDIATRWGGSSLRPVDSTFGVTNDFIMDATKLLFNRSHMREIFEEPMKNNLMK